MKTSENQVLGKIVTEWPDEEEDLGQPPPTRNRAGLWVKGQSGNPAGRPKGMTLKEYVRDMLARMTPEERDKFLMGMPKETIWRMAEGNPTEDRNVSITVPTPILGGITAPQMLQEGEQTLLEGTQ